MTRDEGRWTASATGLWLGELRVSFQRFALPADVTVKRAPASLGVLPVAASGNCFLLPLADEEGFWLGVEAPEGAALDLVTVEAIGTDGDRVLAAELRGMRFGLVTGSPLPHDVFRVFSRRWLRELGIAVGAAVAPVYPTDPETFSTLTGQPVPPSLDASAGYGGWRLP